MSSSVVRTTARALKDHVSWPSEYVDTVATAPDPDSLPAAFSGISFDGQTDDPIGIGTSSPIREIGRVTFSFFRRLGAGDADVIADAEAAAVLIRAHAWSAAGIVPISISAPVTPDESGFGGFIEAQIQVDYERDHT